MSVVRWTHRTCLLAMAAAVIGLAATACGEDDRRSDAAGTGPAGPPGKDVRITACGRDAALGTGSVRGTITNTTAERADYVVHIDFADAAGTVLDSALHAKTGLDSGAEAAFTATGVKSYPDQVTCKVIRVDRAPSAKR
jgi:hypothetical protein